MRAPRAGGMRIARQARMSQKQARVAGLATVALALAFAVGGCGNVTSAPTEQKPDGAVTMTMMDASAPDAPIPHVGPPGRGYSTGGRRTVSAHFVLYSVTGQATPVGV